MLATRTLKRTGDTSVSCHAKPAPVKWQAPVHAKDDAASAVFSATAGAFLAQLRANEAGALAGKDPEYLHQMRVTVRRLRAILSLYSALLGKRQKTKAARELKWLARALGPARDSDVGMPGSQPGASRLSRSATDCAAAAARATQRQENYRNGISDQQPELGATQRAGLDQTQAKLLGH